jgi:hypothetical protein
MMGHCRSRKEEENGHSNLHNQTPICLKVTYQTKTPEHVNPKISDVTKTALHIQQQRIMTGKIQIKKKKILPQNLINTHPYSTHPTLLEDNIPKNNPQHQNM